MSTALLGGAALVVAVLSGATLVGAAVLAWCPGRGRSLSMAPAVGAAAVVLWLCAVGLVVPPGSWVAVGTSVVATLALVSWTVLRRGSGLRALAGSWPGLLTSSLVGLACALPFLLVIHRSGSTALVHLSGNHDGFFFTAVPEWLRSNTLIGAPGVSADGSPVGTPLLGSTWDIVQNGSWRIGSDALTSAVSRATGADPLNLWLPVTITYLVLFATAAHALLVRSGVRGWRAPAMAGVTAGTAAVLDAVIDQHTPTLLALAVLVASVAELTRGSVLTPTGASPLLVAIGVGAVAAVYGELLALVALPLVALVARSWWRRRAIDVRWLGSVLAWSVVVAGAPWIRALLGTTGGNSPEGYRSAFAVESGWFNALHALAKGTDQTVFHWSATPISTRLVVLAFAAVLAGGLLAVGAWGPARSWWLALATCAPVGWWVLGFSDHSGYPQQRFVEWSVPLLVLGSLVGWHAVAERLRHRLGASPPSGTTGSSRTKSPVVPEWAAGSLLVAAMVVLALPGVQHARQIDDDPARRVDHDFADIARWMEVNDPGGSATVVFAQDYFTNLWAPHGLRHHPDTAYLTVYRDYYDVDHFGSIAGRRWLLLDRDALDGAQIPDGALVEANERFGLVELRHGPVVVDVPPLHRGRWSVDGRSVTVRLTEGTAECHDGLQVLPCR